MLQPRTIPNEGCFVLQKELCCICQEPLEGTFHRQVYIDLETCCIIDPTSAKDGGWYGAHCACAAYADVEAYTVGDPCDACSIASD